QQLQRLVLGEHLTLGERHPGLVLVAGLLRGLLGIRLRPGPVAAALTLSAATHYVADRQGGHWRDPEPHGVVRLAHAAGKDGWLRNDPQSGYLLDQAWHHAFEACAALVASA
ncbi:hypothetical protein ABZW03_33585, partial [Kitasatospora sp. NPDC004799]